MRAEGGRILLIDRDPGALEPLSRAIRASGHQVAIVSDPKHGLERAVEIAVDVVLLDRDASVLELRSFIDVLKENPRTSAAHIFLLGFGDPASLKAVDNRVEPILKPFNVAQVAGRIDEVVRARRAPASEQELQGELEQVALFDLLQVFTANLSTGRLRIECEGTSAGIWVRQGRVVDAVFGPTVGEKALHRLLSLQEGSFAFEPGIQALHRRVQGGTDHLLMEAVRRLDERRRILTELPPLTAVLRVESSPAQPEETHRELLAALDEPRSIEELLDLLPANDLELLEAIGDLVREGVLVVVDMVGSRLNFCEADETLAARTGALRLRRAGVEGVLRIGVLAPAARELARFGQALRALREFRPELEPLTLIGEGALGALGRLRVGGFDVELFALPLDPVARPIWGALLAQTTVALLIGPEALVEELQSLSGVLDVRIVAAPAASEGPAEAAASLRALLGTRRPRA